MAEQLQNALNSRILIEQAKGVLAASTGLTMDEAFAALRAYARNGNLTLATAAEGVIARTIDIRSSSPAR